MAGVSSPPVCCVVSVGNVRTRRGDSPPVAADGPLVARSKGELCLGAGEWEGEPLRGSEFTRRLPGPDSRRSVQRDIAKTNSLISTYHIAQP